MLSRFASRFQVMFGLVSLVVCLGCGSTTSEPAATTGVIVGKVTFEGAPVTDGEIVFLNDQTKNEVVGLLDEQGAYQVQGVLFGKQNVSVRPETPPMPKDTMAPRPKPADPKHIPKKYRNPKSSELVFEVKEAKSTFDVSMK
ncbi:hypothetical protein SH668x_002051 [Planctomicrobium sp. SH668]|uniref:hypothetical protein n=1 Tax=Planctomicrobium sp. SH668 TaxID=3448126 RepID=UPI003F5B33CD